MGTDNVMTAYVEFKRSLFNLWNTGYAEGLTESFMLADTKDFVANENDGNRMDSVVEQIWNEWKKQR